MQFINKLTESIKRNLTLLITLILVGGVTSTVFIYIQILFSYKYNLKDTRFYDSFSAYGSFMQGTLGVVLSALNIFFLIYIWNKQKMENEKQQIEKQFYYLLSIRKEIRDEIKYDKNSIVNKQRSQDLDIPLSIDSHTSNILESKEAINKIAQEFAIITLKYKIKTDEVSSQKKGNLISLLEEERRRANEKLSILYSDHGAYLRNYFDIVLAIIEYIDTQDSLTTIQKVNYIKVLKANTSPSEVLIWHLMLYDYEVSNPIHNVKEWIDQVRQDNKFDDYARKYSLSDGKRM